MIDVLLVQSEIDGADLVLGPHGRVELTQGIETALRLSIDGGNAEDQNTTATESDQWWGNLVRDGLPYRSSAQSVIEGSPLTTAALERYGSAIVSDTAWMVDRNLVASVDPAISVQRQNALSVDLVTPSGTVKFSRMLK